MYCCYPILYSFSLALTVALDTNEDNGVLVALLPLLIAMVRGQSTTGHILGTWLCPAAVHVAVYRCASPGRTNQHERLRRAAHRLDSDGLGGRGGVRHVSGGLDLHCSGVLPCAYFIDGSHAAHIGAAGQEGGDCVGGVGAPEDHQPLPSQLLLRDGGLGEKLQL